MSPLACAIQNRFEEVCRTELSRLRRKTASLSDAHRAEVDAISVAVARAIAADIGRALDAETPQNVCNIIERLFHLTAGAGLAEVEGTVPAGVTAR